MNESIQDYGYFYNKFDDISSLELTVKNHPSSSFARLLLLKQYQKSGNPKFEEYAIQTAVYFNDPQWLSFQLFRGEGEQPGYDIEHDTIDDAYPENSLTENKNTEEPLIAEPLVPINPGEEQEAEEQEAMHEAADFTQDKMASEAQTSSEHPEPAPDPGLVANQNDMDPTNDPDSGEQMAEPIEAEELIFEPLHTTDYFASQGVSIKEETLMNDKLGSQMRSFSEWLKSMKQLHPGKLPEQNEVIERIIQSSSEKSNIESEVLTEAMAEVLLKQDKQQKAIEMYEKLSLMNPSKSIYFAAKIESIKNK